MSRSWIQSLLQTTVTIPPQAASTVGTQHLRPRRLDWSQSLQLAFVVHLLLTSMAAPPPPVPKHFIRSHISQVNVIYFSDDNERIYSGDAGGTVVITSTRSLRAIATWKAHTDGLLGIQEWEEREQIITSVRASRPSSFLYHSDTPPGMGAITSCTCGG